MRMLDLCCGRLGWGRAFAARGWEVVGIDLVEPPEIPPGCTFIQRDILGIDADFVRGFDFVCASSPCEQFSVHGMKHFHPNPPYPAIGIKLFEHTRALCEAAGVPYVMENVRAAQAFVGTSRMLCGPFALWGNAVPILIPQGISKSRWFKRPGHPGNTCNESLKGKRERKAKLSTIPPELANAVADYAERILE